MDTMAKQSSSSITKFEGEFEFLSNFSKSPILYEGILYDTVEHAFQAAKTTNVNERKLIALLETPGRAKRAGRTLKLRSNWNGIRVEIMTDLLTLKFADPVLRQKLLDTGNAQLVEGNTWHDNFWGICECEDCKNTGVNTLGQLLMSVRALIQKGLL